MRGLNGPRPLCIVMLVLLTSLVQSRTCRAADVQPALRRPVSLVLADDRWLLAANRRSGSISVIDAAERRVVDEVSIGRRLSDLVALPDGRHLLCTDEAAHELIVLSRMDSSLAVVDRLPVSPYPVSIEVLPGGRSCCVASLWSRRLTLVDLSGLPTGKAAVDRTLSMPFAPREQLAVRGGAKLIVADSFGGRLAVIDMERFEIDALRKFPAHNVRGLALDPSGEKLLVSHQINNSLAQTTENDVHWGILLINVLRWLRLDNVLSPSAEILAASHVQPAGDSTGAGGDPAALAITSDGTVLQALSGVGQMSFGKEKDYALRRVAVGRRPMAVIADRAGRLAYVANMFDDSVSIVDLAAAEVVCRVSLGSQPELSPADRGEILFHDARLSLDGWFSCHSCHTDGHTNGQLVDNLGDDSFGAAKRVLSLLGTTQTGPWAWNGSEPDLAQQIRTSITSTMQGEEPAAATIADLAAYLATLAPPPSLAVFDPAHDPAAAARGRQVFEARGCIDCHAEPHYTSPIAYDVALPDKLGAKLFNPPSLRGVSQSDAFFHDNRAATLADVFTQHGHGLEEDLSPRDLEDLLHFLIER